MKIRNKNNKNLKRLNEIIKVLRKYEFSYLVEHSGLYKKLPFKIKRNKTNEELDDNLPVRLRMSMQELGTTYIKLGQTLSTRPDLVGNELAEELKKLQADNPPISYETVKEVIESELGDKIENIYKNFDKEPLGSASIGQVHKATLTNGKEVAIKIQKPGVEELVKTDLTIMKFLANKINQYIRKSKIYNLPAIVNEFERSILKEIDYEQELNNISHLSYDFKDDYSIYVPKVYPKYSTKKVLTMEFIKGKKVSEVIDNPEGYDTKLIAKRGLNSYVKQIMFNGFFHADPHPANIYILNNNIVCFIDMGMMGIMDKDFRENLAELFLFFISKDVNNMINQLNYMDIINEDIDIHGLKYDLTDLMNKYYGTELNNMEGGMLDLMDLMIKYDVILPREFVLMARGLAMIEEIGLNLNSEFNAVEELTPLAKKLISKKMSPSQVVNYVKSNIIEVEHLLKRLPHTINRTLYKIQNDKLTIELVHKNVDKITNKIAMAIIIAALLVGSSLVILSDKGFTLFDIPILGLFGFVISLTLGLWTVLNYMDD